MNEPTDIPQPPEYRRVVVMVALALVVALTVVFILRSDVVPPVQSGAVNVHPKRMARQQVRVDSARDYRSVIASIDSTRRGLAVRYTKERSRDGRAQLLADAGDTLTNAVVSRLAPFWVGTAWSFNGTSETPQEGSIACGYFVTTLLRDAGLRLNRVRLAQLASESIIRSLVGRDHIRRFSNVSLAEFVDEVKLTGRGLYIVGLDYHVGLIANTGSEILFIHSSFVAPGTVVIEHAALSPVLAASRYRVIGRLTADRGAMERWLTGGS